MRSCASIRSTRSAGFSLIETLVSLALLAGAAASLAATTITASRSVEASRRRSEALALAVSTLDILQSAPDGHSWVQPGGDPDRPVASADGVWFAAAGDYQVCWRIQPVEAVPVARVEIAVHFRSSADARPPLVRLSGTRGGLAP